MQAQNTNPKPTRQDLHAAEAGGWTDKLSAAAAAAWTAYDRLVQRVKQEGVRGRNQHKRRSFSVMPP